MKTMYLLLFIALSLNAIEIVGPKDSKKEEMKSSLEGGQKIITKEDGVVREKYIPKSEFNLQKNTVEKKGLVIKFNDAASIDIAAFEAKYSIQFKRKLSTGYYIFDNFSSTDDNTLVEEIIANETGVKTVKVNESLGLKPY